MRFVLDASVAVKLYAYEVDSADALSWFDVDAAFAVPDIFLVEVAQALLRHRRDGSLSEAELFGAVDEMARLVHVPAASEELVAVALGLASRLHHRLHDCMYLALAQRIDAPLLTADMRLARKVRDHALAIRVVLHTERLS